MARLVQLPRIHDSRSLSDQQHEEVERLRREMHGMLVAEQLPSSGVEDE